LRAEWKADAPPREALAMKRQRLRGRRNFLPDALEHAEKQRVSAENSIELLALSI
jgi:hypothetical protein